jgi:glycosyltransferase involved in cell wall biosynthesis
MTTENMPTALVFRTRLLPYSETFIRSQADAMKRYRPFYVGFRKVGGFSVPAKSSWIANDGGVAGLLRELRIRWLGPHHGDGRQLGALRPAVLHAHFGPDACEALPWASMLNIPLIATFHGYDATLSDKGFQRTRDGRSYLRKREKLNSQATQFIAVSEFIRGKLVERGLPAERIAVHYIGVDVDRFERTEFEVRRRQVLFTGRLVKKKGCSHLIDAMAIVQAQFPDVELVVIGDGDQREDLEKKASRSLQKYRFLGAQSPMVVMEEMQTSLVFCVPSVTAPDGDAEGFGIVFAEAQACGLPVVSFASGGIPEAVGHGESGFLAPEGDWRQLADYICSLIRNRELWEQFSQAGRKRVETQFDLRRQTMRLEQLYERVTTNGR